MTTTRPDLTWEALVAAEPELAVLLAEVRAVRDTGHRATFCANAVWYGAFKPRLGRLVGWEWGDDAVLGSAAAYDLAYALLYGALPDCRNCGCA